MLEDGQVFALASVEPYTRKDGCQSCLLHWATSCPTTGKAFTVTTGLSFNPAMVRRYHPTVRRDEAAEAAACGTT
jgi:hypothetical protein